MGTIDVLSRKMARPAGFEPATPGLEGRKLLSELSEIRRNFFHITGRFQADPRLAARPHLGPAPPRPREAHSRPILRPRVFLDT